MRNNASLRKPLGKKLVAVLDINLLKLFKAEGLKIIESLGVYKIHSDTNHKESRNEGFNSKKGAQAAFFDPHTAPKDIEYMESSKAAVDCINKAINKDASVSELCLVTNSKMLGHIRQQCNKHKKLKKMLHKEVTKDLIHHEIIDIEKALFH